MKKAFLAFFRAFNITRLIIINLVFWAILLLVVLAFVKAARRARLLEDLDKSEPSFNGLVLRPSDFQPSVIEDSYLGLRKAAADPRVRYIFLDLSTPSLTAVRFGAGRVYGFAQLLRQASKRGAIVFSYAPSYSLSSLLLTKPARRYMNPIGLLPRGSYSLATADISPFLQKVGVKFTRFHEGAFKTGGSTLSGPGLNVEQTTFMRHFLQSEWMGYLFSLGVVTPGSHLSLASLGPFLGPLATDSGDLSLGWPSTRDISADQLSSYISSPQQSALDKNLYFANIYGRPVGPVMTKTFFSSDGKQKQTPAEFYKQQKFYFPEAKFPSQNLIAGEAQSAKEAQSAMLKRLSLKKGSFRLASLSYYTKKDKRRILKGCSTGKKCRRIGLMQLNGEIKSGSSRRFSRQTAISVGPTLDLIKKASASSLDALVIDINTPGGDAGASELIRQRLLGLKSKMPIVFYSSSLLASGGYMLSTAATKIVSSPTAIVGSIGVYAMIPSAAPLAQHFGITSQIISLNPVSDQFERPSVFRDPSPASAALYKDSIQSEYFRFQSYVAASRHMSLSQIQSLVGGRVFSGISARQKGLTDRVGSLSAALNLANVLADGSKDGYRVVPISLSQSKFGQYARGLGMQSKESSLLRSGLRILGLATSADDADLQPHLEARWEYSLLED